MKTSEAEALAWLLNLFEELQSRQSSSTSSNFPQSKFAKSGNLSPKHGDCARETDIVVVTRPIKTKNSDQEETHISWHNVRVIGKLKSKQGSANRDSSILQLANYAREVFGNQPNRRWVHGFILTGCLLRVWRLTGQVLADQPSSTFTKSQFSFFVQ